MDEDTEFGNLDAAQSNDNTSNTDVSNVSLQDQLDTSGDDFTYSTAEDIPLGVRGQLTSGTWVTRNADGSTTYEDPDGTPYTVKSDGTYTGGGGDSTWTYNPATGESSGTGAYAGGISGGGWSNVLKQLKGTVMDSKGNLDIAKLLPLLGGLMAANKSNTRTQPSGYQGGIPRYTATRQAPGEGQRLSGNVLFTKPDGTVVNPGTAGPATARGLPAALPTNTTTTTTPAFTDINAYRDAQKAKLDPTQQKFADTFKQEEEIYGGAGKTAPPSFANDPEYIRLVNARNAVRGGGDLMTMDYKPEDAALDAYLRSKNPTFRQDRESAMRQAAAGLPAIAPTAPTYIPGSGGPVDYSKLEEGGPKYNENPVIDPSVLAMYKAQPSGLSSIASKVANAVGANYKPTAADVANSQAQENAAKANTVQAAAGGHLRSGGFVIPADVVSHFGNGSSDAGLKVLAEKIGATPIKGRGDGMSDSIRTSIDGQQQARVAHEEAYMSPEKVARLGGGDSAKGAQKLRNMMARIREARTGTTEQGRQINPNKFMPGGTVRRFDVGGSTGTTGTGTGSTVGANVNAGITGTESNLSNWAGPYVTDMLAKGQALSELPYEQYTGALTAGPSALQQKTFEGLQGVNFPGNLGQTFTGQTAQQYMNPYLQAVLDPQLEEMRRSAKINNLQGLGQFTKSGAYGGSRQAIMESENARNLLQQQNKAIAEGYANAYDKAMGQFNTEQGQAKTLVDLLGQQGQTQRGIEAEQVGAEKKQFEEARENPYKMVQFQQSLLQGLPLTAQQYNLSDTNNLTQFTSGLALLAETMKKLGISPAP